MSAGSEEGIDKQTHEGTADDDGRIFPATAGPDLIPKVTQFIHGACIFDNSP